MTYTFSAIGDLDDFIFELTYSGGTGTFVA